MDPPAGFHDRDRISIGKWRPGMTFGDFAEVRREPGLNRPHNC